MPGVEIGSGTFAWQRRGEEYRWDKTPGKKRYLPFYEQAGALLASGMPVEEAALVAGRAMGWMSNQSGLPLSDEQVRKKALGVLKRPDAGANIGKFFKKAANYDAVEMAQDAVKFIKGEMKHTRIVLDKEGTQHEITENLPPSEGMLKTVMSAVLPKSPKQIQIDSRMQIMKIGMNSQGVPPKLAARKLETIEGEVAD